MSEVKSENIVTSWKNFLETIPPGRVTEVSDAFIKKNITVEYSSATIELYCDSDKCKGLRIFSAKYLPVYKSSYHEDVFLSYWCRNCESQIKTFAIRARKKLPQDDDDHSGIVVKFGEFPFFGPSVPSRVLTLIGPDREIFLQGRRAENQGMGIGSFAYYRRVIENQKGRLISEIAKVAKRLGASSDKLEQFKRAEKETQFSKAIDDVKDVIPPSLFIRGHNPLALLHRALSEGLHAGSDSACLELATSIRVVLTELSERITMALKDEAELTHALNRLLLPPSSATSENSSES